MPPKNIDDIQPGEVLAEDVTNAQGVVLARAGATVSAAHLRLFRTWGITALPVAGDENDSPGPAPVSQEHLNRAEATLLRRFGGAPEDEVTAEVFRISVEMRAKKIAAGEIDERG